MFIEQIILCVYERERDSFKLYSLDLNEEKY